jgi:hypothetical protein
MYILSLKKLACLGKRGHMVTIHMSHIAMGSPKGKHSVVDLDTAGIPATKGNLEFCRFVKVRRAMKFHVA